MFSVVRNKAGTLYYVLQDRAEIFRPSSGRLGACFQPLLKKTKPENIAAHSRVFLPDVSIVEVIDKVAAKFAKKDHPFYKRYEDFYGILADKNIVQRLNDFYEKYFSAHLLTVAIIGAEPVDVLIEKVRGCLSEVPVRQLPTLRRVLLRYMGLQGQHCHIL